MSKRNKFNEYKLLVLRTVYSRGGISRTRLGKALGIRLATITEIGRELIGEGLLGETEKIRNPRGVGKKETLLEIVPGGKYFIGCELFPDKISLGFLNLSGCLVYRKTVPLREKEKFAVLEKIVVEIEKGAKNARVGMESIFGLGFVDPGIIDIERGYSVASTIMPHWKQVPTRSYLSSKLKLPVFMMGTSQARALAECLFGSGKGVSNFIFLEYSKGIACGIVSEGMLIRGRSELAGEFGHFVLPGREELCGCGRKGCLEAVAGAPALEERARKASMEASGKVLDGLLKEKSQRTAIQTLVLAASMGDRASLEILDEASGHIAMAVSNLVHVLDPAKVIIDSSFLAFGNEFIDILFKRIKKDVIFPVGIAFEVSGLDSFEGALGGAGLALHEFLGMDIARA